MAYVEFENQESVLLAVSLTGQQILGKIYRIYCLIIFTNLRVFRLRYRTKYLETLKAFNKL